jgi:hypothetical protein
VKILFAHVARATILTRKHRWLWPYHSRRTALSARQSKRPRRFKSLLQVVKWLAAFHAFASFAHPQRF